MPESKTDNRTRLLRAAVKVTHRYGFDPMSLADIAKEARMPLGNLYYYFKTKDEIGNAIIDLRISRLRLLLQKLNKKKSPKERLCGFAQLKIDNRDVLARSGCPVGTLSSELRKHGGAVADKASILFAEGLAWMEAQFKALGKSRAESRMLAVHLMAALQGVSLLAHSFRDPRMVSIEVAHLKKWIRAL
jgi:AcrR family transcriptional regulator